MESNERSAAFILAREIAAATPGVSVRHSDSHGSAAFTDPRLHEQLAVITGRSLSQFRIAVNGTGLAFWGDSAAAMSREIFIEHPTLVLSCPGKLPAAHAVNSEAVASALVSVLGQRVSEITLTGGQLTVNFESHLMFTIDPDPHYESWQISSDDGLLIVCTPGGDLTIWYPPSNA